MTRTKTTLSFLVGFTMLLGMLHIAPPVHAQGFGDLVTCPDSNSVYYIASDGTRWVFPNDKTFFTWRTNFDDVTEHDCEDLADFSIGGVITYNPGTRLVKIQTVPDVFAVEPGGILRHIQSEEQAEELYGSDWNQRIDDVSDGFWPSYTLGEPIPEDTYPSGSIVHATALSTYYYIDGDTAKEIPIELITEFEDQFAISTATPYSSVTIGDTIQDDELERLKDIAWRPDSQEEDEQEEETTPPDSLDKPVLTISDVDAISSEEYTLSWPEITDAKEYVVEEDDNDNFTSPEEISRDSSTSIDVSQSVTSTKKYYYRVKAVHGSVESDWSATANISINPYHILQSVPDEDQPPNNSLGFSDTSNWSAGLAAGNILYYFDVVKVKQKALDITADKSIRQVADYLGWYFGTNGEGSELRENQDQLGVINSDLYEGLNEYILWKGSTMSSYGFPTPGQLGGKNGYETWDTALYTSDTDTDNEALQAIIDEITDSRPTIAVFDYWNPVELNEDFESGVAYFHAWGDEIASSDEITNPVISPPSETWDAENGVGHAVTVVGVIGNHDIDDGNGPQDWLVVHDTWSGTAKDLAIPFDNWSAVITMEPK